MRRKIEKVITPFDEFVSEIRNDKIVTEVRVQANSDEDEGPAYEVAVTLKSIRAFRGMWAHYDEHGFQISKLHDPIGGYFFTRENFEEWNQEEFLTMLKNPSIELKKQSVLILPGDRTNDPELLEYVKEIEDLPITVMKLLRMKSYEAAVKEIKEDMEKYAAYKQLQIDQYESIINGIKKELCIESESED